MGFMRTTLALAGAVVVTVSLATPAVGQIIGSTTPPRTLQLAFHEDGTVSLTAGNVTVREILSEWARQCGCYIVNWDKLTGGPLTIPVAYQREPQKKVLESLLRQAAGFVLTPKRPGSTIVSNYETIYIVATSNPVGGAYVPPATPMPPPMTMPTPGSPDDEIPAAIGQPGPAPTGPPRPGMPTPMPGNMPGMPTNTPPPSGGRFGAPGTPSVFVPIVPVGSTPAPPAPGMPTSAPTTPSGAPVPIVPAPQNR